MQCIFAAFIQMLIMMVLRQCLGFALKQDRNNCKRQS